MQLTSCMWPDRLEDRMQNLTLTADGACFPSNAGKQGGWSFRYRKRTCHYYAERTRKIKQEQRMRLLRICIAAEPKVTITLSTIVN